MEETDLKTVAAIINACSIPSDNLGSVSSMNLFMLNSYSVGAEVYERIDPVL